MSRKKISEINVTPLVDVMLVLLIIFMITAPMLNHGIKVNLPISKAGKLTDNNNKPIILNIDEKKDIYINKTKVKYDSLKTRLKYIYKNKEQKEIFIKADKNLKYGFIAKVINVVKESKINKIGLVTIPPENK